MAYVPVVVERTEGGTCAIDIYSKLVQERIVFLSDEVTQETSRSVIAQIMYLEAKDPHKDIHFYINSYGGSVTAGMAIYDTMNYVQCDVATYCMGVAASMGAFLLAGGTKGKRYSMPNSEIMIHQPIGGGTRGQASDLEIEATHILQIREKLNRILAQNTGKSIEEIAKATDRNYWLSAQEALNYGIVDNIIEKRELKRR